MKRNLKSSLWLRITSLMMATVFFYVQIAYTALEPASRFWQERKKAAEELFKEKQDLEKENSAVKVALPEQENALLAQIPSLEHNILRSRIIKPEEFGASAIAYTNLSGIREKITKEAIKNLPSWFQTISLSYVSLSDLYLPPKWKSGDLMVIHVQDAHENYEAQKNIAKVIESLASGEHKQLRESSQSSIVSSRPLMIVGLEGAKGEFDFTPYRTFPSKKISRGVAEYLLKESLIGGPEFSGMTLGVDSKTDDPSRNEPPILFWGIEDEHLYLEHVKAFKESIPKEKEGIEIQKRLSRHINRLKEKLFNPNLKELDASITQYHSQTIQLGSYIKILTWKGVPSGFRMIQNFLNALTLEETLNYDLVEKEKKGLTNELIEKISKQELKNLMSASLSYRLGNISYGMFYRYLLELCKAYSVRIVNYPEMDKYIRYVLISDGIRSEELFSEIEELEKRRVESLISNPVEKALVELGRDLNLTEKLLNYRMSPTEWERYQKRKKEIRNITNRMEELMKIAWIGFEDDQLFSFYKFLEPFERFNDRAILRNEVLVKNLLQKFKAIDPKSSSVSSRIAVLISGGFHTQGMTKILQDKKIAYAVLTPCLGKIEGKGTEYLEIFRRDKTPLEKLFTGERITLKSQLPLALHSMGEEPANLSAIEGISDTLGKSGEAIEILKRITNIDRSVKEEIRERLKSTGKGYRTIRSSTLGVTKEWRKHDSRFQGAKFEIRHLRASGEKVRIDVTVKEKGEVLKDDTGNIVPIASVANAEIQGYEYFVSPGKLSQFEELENNVGKAANILARFGGWWASKTISILFAPGWETLFLSLPYRLLKNLLHLSMSDPLGLILISSVLILTGVFLFAGAHGRDKDFSSRLFAGALFTTVYLIATYFGGAVWGYVSTAVTHAAYNALYFYLKSKGIVPPWMGLATISKTKEELEDYLAAEKEAKRLINRIFKRKKDHPDLGPIVQKINKIHDPNLTVNDFKSGEIEISFLGQGTSKWVFEVTIDRNIHIALGITKLKSEQGITKEELRRLNILQQTGRVAKLLHFGKARKRDYIMTLFEAGESPDDLDLEDKLTQKKKKAIVESFLVIAKTLAENGMPAQMTSDVHGGNIQVREDPETGEVKAVIIDLGGNMMDLNDSLLQLAEYYGDESGENDYIFQTYLEVFGEKDGMEILSKNMESLERRKHVLIEALKKQNYAIETKWYLETANHLIPGLRQFLDANKQLLEKREDLTKKKEAESKDPLKEQEKAEQDQIKSLQKLTLDQLKTFWFMMGDLDNISLLNKILGKQIVGGIGPSGSPDLLFMDEGVQTLFYQLREELNSLMEENIHKGSGGDEFVPELQEKDSENMRERLEKIIQSFNTHFINEYSVIRVEANKGLSEEQINEQVEEMRKKLEGQKNLLGVHTIVRYGSGINILVKKRRRANNEIIHPIEKILTKSITSRWKVYPLSVETDRVGLFTVSIGAVNAQHLLEYMLRKLIEEKFNEEAKKLTWGTNNEKEAKKQKIKEKVENEIRSYWLTIGSDRKEYIHPDRVEEFYTWGMRFANDMLSEAKKDKINEKTGEVEIAGRFKVEVSVSNEKNSNYIANVTKKPITLEKVEETRRYLLDQKSKKSKGETTNKDIDTRSGAYQEAAYRSKLNDSPREYHYMFKIVDYGLNAYEGTTRGFHNAKSLVKEEGGDKIVEMLFKDQDAGLHYLLKNGGLLGEVKGEEGVIMARAPPDTAYFASDKPIRGPPELLETMRDRFKNKLNQTFKDQIEAFRREKNDPNFILNPQLLLIEVPKTTNLPKHLENYFKSQFQTLDIMTLVEWLFEAVDSISLEQLKEAMDVVETGDGVTVLRFSDHPQKIEKLMKLYRQAQDQLLKSSLKELRAIRKGITERIKDGEKTDLERRLRRVAGDIRGQSLTEYGMIAAALAAILIAIAPFLAPLVTVLGTLLLEGVPIPFYLDGFIHSFKKEPKLAIETLDQSIIQKLKESLPQELLPKTKSMNLNDLTEIINQNQVQLSDQARNILHATKLLEWIDHQGMNPKNRSGVHGQVSQKIELSDLPRVIGYLSFDELLRIINRFRELYKEDRKDAERSFGIFAERLFRLGGETGKDFNELWNAYLGLRRILVPEEKISNDQIIEMNKQAQIAYNHGVQIRQDFRVQPFPEEFPEDHTLHFHVSSLDGNGIKSLADQIKKQYAKEIKNPIFISTHKEEVTEDALIAALSKLDVDQGMVQTLFPMGLSNYLITRDELKKKQFVDPGIEIDPESLYEIILERMQTIHGRKVTEVNLNIFTDQMIFKENWRKELKITLNLLISPTQIIPISSQLAELFKAREVLSLQQ